jgi:hypothetical protein
LLVFPSVVYKWSINPFTNPYPVYSHTRDRVLALVLRYCTCMFSTKAETVCSVGTVQWKGAAPTSKNLKAWTGPKNIVSSNHER